MPHGQIIYNNTRLVISSTERQYTIISEIHKVLGHDPKAKAMASHCASHFTFFWRNIIGDVEEFIKKWDQCQKQEKI